MKKVVGLLAVIITATFLPAVHAEEKPAIAIIDTAVDTTKIKVAYEVCIMEEKRCPNKQVFMEGVGAATLPVDQIYKNGFDHGTKMSLVASKINPDINIVFIRIVPMTNTGTMGIYTDNTVNNAMQWVIKNKSKFNIVAVSTSFGSHSFKKTGVDYCPVNTNLRNTIVSLQNLGTASFFAAGNNYDKSRIDYPSCISEAVAVGSVNQNGSVELYSNGGLALDFNTLGTYDINGIRIMGTSPATAALASYWVKSYKGSYQTTYDYLKSVSKDLAVTIS